MSEPFEIESVGFSGPAAIPLWNHRLGAEVPMPQYVMGGPNESIAYVAGSMPQLVVVLRRLPAFKAGKYVIGASGPLGGVASRAIELKFDGKDVSRAIMVELGQPLPNMVQRLKLSLNWWARGPGDSPAVTAIGSTSHNMFVTLAVPTDPWSADKTWVAALEVACGWASGATTLDEAAARITEKYNASGRVAYDTVSGAPHYTANDHRTFNLSEMLDRLTGGIGLGGKVNCMDSAMTVSTLANVLGCDLWQARMAGPNGFELNPIQAIGYSTWEVPFEGGFSYHEVAWKGGCSINDRLFDGCLKVDGDDEPWTAPHHPLLPVNMRFGDCVTMEYRKRLTSKKDCPNCKPVAGSKTRRPLV